MFGYGGITSGPAGLPRNIRMNAFIHALSRHLKSSEPPNNPSGFQIPQRAARCAGTGQKSKLL